MNSEPSRLDRIEAIVHSNARAIAGLAAEFAEERAEQRNVMGALTQMMQVAAEERAELRGQILELARAQQQMAERQEQMAERQEQMAERQRETDERFNILLEEVRFLIRRMDHNPSNDP